MALVLQAAARKEEAETYLRRAAYADAGDAAGLAVGRA